MPLLRGSRRNIAITFSVKKLEWRGYPTVKKCEDMFSRFNTILVCDGQTDGQTSPKRPAILTAKLHADVLAEWGDVASECNQVGLLPGTCLSPARRRGDWLTCAAYFICLWCGRNLMNLVAPFAPSRFLVAITNCDVWTPLLCPRPVGGALRGHRRPSSVRPSVCLSDVVYIGSNSKTKRPMKTKLCTGVPQVTCDSHTDFNVKRSKVKVSRGGGILWQPPSRTAC